MIMGAPQHRQSDGVSTQYDNSRRGSIIKRRKSTQKLPTGRDLQLSPQLACIKDSSVKHLEESLAAVKQEHLLVKDPSITIQEDINLAVNQLKQQIKAVRQGPSAADLNVQLYFQQISQLGYAPAERVNNAQITTNTESDAHYRKYHLKNNSNERLRPFYKWKDGFIDNYLKYCSPESLMRRAQRVKVPHQQEQGADMSTKPGPSYLEGNFNRNALGQTSKEAVDSKNHQSSERMQPSDAFNSPKLSSNEHLNYLPSPHGGESDYMLKSSLFNKDKIIPMNKYYYNSNGDMSRLGRRKKASGVRSLIEKAEKDLVLAQLTFEFGNKAFKIMNEIEESGNLHVPMKIIEEYENFRLNPPQREVIDLSKMTLQHQSNLFKISQESSLNDITTMNDYDPYKKTAYMSLNAPQKPIQQVNIRPNKIKVILNSLTEDGKFECKQHSFKLSDIQDLDHAAFLALCQQTFQTTTNQKFLFSEDGGQIHNFKEVIHSQQVPDQIFVSTYPYFIGQRAAPFKSERKAGVMSQHEPLQIIPGRLISDPSKIASVLEQDLAYLSPLPKDAKKSDLLLLLKQRQHTPSLIAKRTEFKPDFANKNTFHKQSKSVAPTFYGHFTFNQPGNPSALGQRDQPSPQKRRSVFKITKESPHYSPNREVNNNSELVTKTTNFFPSLNLQNGTNNNFPVQKLPTQTLTSMHGNGVMGNTSQNGMSDLSQISFKDYVSTFSKESDSKSTPYSKFYNEAIRKHREQMYSQMSEVSKQKKKIIHHLRISEEDIPIPKESKVKIGEMLSKDQDAMKVGGGSMNPQSYAPNGRNENSGLILRTLEGTLQSKGDIFHIPPSNENLFSPVQRESENLLRLKGASQDLIRRCLRVASKISLINRDSMTESLLSSWLMRVKGEQSDADYGSFKSIETKIFQAIRQAGIQSQNRRSVRQLELEVAQLRKDLQRLYIYIAKQATAHSDLKLSTPEHTFRAPEVVIADLVEAVGLTKGDVEGYGNRLSQNFRDGSSLEEELSDGGQSLLTAAHILQPRVNVENLEGEAMKESSQTNPFSQSVHPLSQQQARELVNSRPFEALFPKLQTCMFNKNELNLLRQTYQIIAYALGNTALININTLKDLFKDSKITEQEEGILLKNILAAQGNHLLNKDSAVITLKDESINQQDGPNAPKVEVHNSTLSSHVSWLEYLHLLTQSRLEKLFICMSKELVSLQNGTYQTLLSPKSLTSGRRLAAAISRDLLRIEDMLQDQPRYIGNWYLACLEGLEVIKGKGTREEARRVVEKHTEIVILWLVSGL